MNDFEPLVIVERDGQEVKIPVAQFIQAQSGSDGDDPVV